MASSSSTKQHSSSRFSTFKVFRFTGSKPPRPPPKDPNYLYPASNNPSLVSLSNQSLCSQHTSASSVPSQTPKNRSNGNGALSVRSQSPTPSRLLQSSPQQQLQEQQPPPPSMSSSTLVPDSSSSSGTRGFFRKMSTIGKRSASKPRRAATVDDSTDEESISRPYNVQVSPLFSCHLSGHNLIFFSFPFCRARVMSVRTRSYDNTAPYPHR
jgi:hypothetical protein